MAWGIKMRSRSRMMGTSSERKVGGCGLRSKPSRGMIEYSACIRHAVTRTMRRGIRDAE